MKYSLIIFFLLIISCAHNLSKSKTKKVFNSKGFAYIYSDKDFDNKLISKSLDNNFLEISHNKLKVGTLIKLVNPKTNDSIILKNLKKTEYPEFYKILITIPVAKKLNLRNDLPLVEIIEIKKNRSFVAEKTKIFKEEEQIHSNAPVESVKIDNISINNKSNKKLFEDKFYINIAEFYSKNSALLLKDRITNELSGYNSAKLFIKTKKTNKISLLSGPYSSINLMRNDYIKLKILGFEELDININE
jgi:hypothetical protein